MMGLKPFFDSTFDAEASRACGLPVFKVCELDCGESIGVALNIRGHRRAWRIRNPFFRWDERKGGKR